MPAEHAGASLEAPDLAIEVPGSIANLGAGFDTLAVAIQLYLRLRVRAAPGVNELHFQFTNLQLDGENYIERAFRFLASQGGGSFPSLFITVHSDIPTKAGLGSSAAATVAGLRLYEAIAGPLPPQGLLNAACALEGHPDNVAAALLGGLTVSCQMPDRSVFAVCLPWPESLRFIVLTPKLSLSTYESRRALPRRIAREDAVFNLQRVALFLQALQSGDFSLLREALHDRIHQPFRQKLVPGLEAALTLEHPDLLGVCLSGAGPSIVALAERNFDAVERALQRSFLPTGLEYTIRRLSAHTDSCTPAVMIPSAQESVTT
ncbi:MAG: homoserine kinase, partial [Acidobacteriaceae bacterium]|nr:homoserine kinase [Acidobacteriaceae bacterium]MBV9767286.1 homoserine kinase [Acidobacteriaceae bacterium]